MEEIQSPENQRAILTELASMKMPFGKYEGKFLHELPEPYLVWFSQKGFPAGKLGDSLRLMHEIKVNGLEYLIKKIQKS